MNICATDIKMEIGNNQILKGVSIDSKSREFIGIIGPNGSGKSTLLKCIYRTLKPNNGCIMLGRQDISKMSVKESAKKLAVVAQHNYYNFDFSVGEVVLMGRSPHKKSLEPDNSEDYDIVNESLEKVGMLGFKNRSFSTLSGGEQQRVALARALVNEPPILLADEPTGNLDPKNSWEIMKLLERINEERGTTILVVTHNREIVNEMKKRVITMKKGVVISDEEKGGYIDED